MARIALVEVAFDSVESPAARFLVGASFYVYGRGTETEADLYDDDSGGSKLDQPLVADQSGRIRSQDGEIAWAAEGSYDVVHGDETIPWEAAKGGSGGGGGGAVDSVIEELATSGKGYVNHGEDAGKARPSGFASIEWHGSAEPENAVDGDTWIEDF